MDTRERLVRLSLRGGLRSGYEDAGCALVHQVVTTRSTMDKRGRRSMVQVSTRLVLFRGKSIGWGAGAKGTIGSSCLRRTSLIRVSVQIRRLNLASQHSSQRSSLASGSRRARFAERTQLVPTL